MISDEDLERAEAYALIGYLFNAPPDGDILAMLGEMEGDDSPIGQAAADLGRAARETPPGDIDLEFAELFVGLVTREEVSPNGAVHLTGSMYGEVLLKLREDLRAMGVAKAEDVSETEDHIAILCQVMAGLLKREIGTDVDDAAIGAFFMNHLAPWASKFARAVEQTEGLKFYAPAARFGRLFLESESARYN